MLETNEIGAVEAVAGGGWASHALSPTPGQPTPAPIPEIGGNADVGEDQAVPRLTPSGEVPDLSHTIDLLKALQRRRNFAIRTRNRITSALGALVRSACGWTQDLNQKPGDEDDAAPADSGVKKRRKAVIDRANRIIGVIADEYDRLTKAADAEERRVHRAIRDAQKAMGAKRATDEQRREAGDTLTAAIADLTLLLARRQHIERAAVDGAATLDDPADETLARQLGPTIVTAIRSAEPWDDALAQTHKQMEAAARTLPVYPWAQAINGFGDRGLAIIVGEAGDLSVYANPAKLWKRMGLAVIDGKRQGSPGGGATAEDWIRHAYCKPRRSQMFVIADSLLKKESEYRDLFLTRLPTEVQNAGPDHPTIAFRGVKKNARGEEYDSYSAHARARARRYVEKRLLRNLWRAWRDASANHHTQQAAQ